MKIYLVDKGQDFLSFDVVDGKISNANLQGWMWNGRKIAYANRLKVGDYVRLQGGRQLLQPIAKIER